jgi:hypothetical protein
MDRDVDGRGTTDAALRELDPPEAAAARARVASAPTTTPAGAPSAVRLAVGLAVLLIAALAAPSAMAGSPKPVLIHREFVSAETLGVRFVRDRSRIRPMDGDPNCNTWDYCWDVRNKQKDGRPLYYLTSATGPGGGTITLTHTYGWSQSYSAGASFGYKGLLTAEFGFEVGASGSQSYSYAYKGADRSKCYRIKSFAAYQDWKGDIWVHPDFSHWRYYTWVRTWRFDGIEFRVYVVAC